MRTRKAQPWAFRREPTRRAHNVLPIGVVLGCVHGVLIVVASLLMMGCTPYRAGAALQTHEGSRRFECLDLHIAHVYNRARSWVTFEYSFGNHCRHAVPLDLSAVRVEATQPSRRTLRPFDPRGEIHPATLDGGMHGREIIAYTIPPEWVGERLEVCVFVDEVAVPLAEPRPLCIVVSGVRK